MNTHGCAVRCKRIGVARDGSWNPCVVELLHGGAVSRACLPLRAASKGCQAGDSVLQHASLRTLS